MNKKNIFGGVSTANYDDLLGRYFRLWDERCALKAENDIAHKKNNELFLENAKLKTTILEIRRMIAKYESGETDEQNT